MNKIRMKFKNFGRKGRKLYIYKIHIYTIYIIF